MGNTIFKIARKLILATTFISLGMLASGCVIRTDDGRRIAFRVAQGTADQVVQQGDGGMQYVQGLDPKGDTLMVFVRGQLP
ncbi:MAG: hypothetical protein MUC50_16700 [Myxococcota bacterium]|nr:hypothetical protein [Myxococcota bacterium]